MSKIGEKISSTSTESLHQNELKDTALKPRIKDETIIASPDLLLAERSSSIHKNSTMLTSQLFLALEDNKMAEFEKMIHTMDQKTVAELRNPEGQTITHAAVLKKNIEAILLLRSANGGALGSIINQSGETVNSYIQAQNEDFRAELTQATQKQNAAIEQKNISDLFKAVENNDQSLFEFLMTKVDRQKIASFKNDEGQTITHLIIEKHNIPAYLILRQSNESALGGIKNSKGETVNDSIEKQTPDFKINLRKAIVEQSKKQGIAQALLLEKAAIFLKMRLNEMKKQNPTENSPQAQHIQELEEVISSMGGAGYCNGFAVAWLEMFVLNLSDQFCPGLSLLRDWDESAETITPELTKMMDTLMQRIIFYQYDKSSVAKIINTDSSTENLPSGQASKLSLFIDNPDLLFPIERLEIKSDLIPTEFLSALLHEGSGMQIGSLGTHAIAVGQKNGSYYLYDSNYKGDEENFSTLIGGVQYNNIHELSKAIRHRLWDVFGKGGPFHGYTISVIDLKKSNHHYPTKSEINDKMTIATLNQNKALTPLQKFHVILNKNIKDLPFIQDIISQLDISEINDENKGSFLLNEAIKSESSRLSDIVKLLLNKGAKLTYDEFDHTLIHALLSRNTEIVKLIYHADPKAAESLPDYMQDELKKHLQ